MSARLDAVNGLAACLNHNWCCHYSNARIGVAGNGDWGDLSDDDKQANEDALADGSRILSSCVLEGEGDDTTKLWIVTEAEDDSGDRLATTLILADEY